MENVQPLFLPKEQFGKDLVRRVNEHFARTNTTKKGTPLLFIKAGILFLLLIGFYVAGFLFDWNLWVSIMLGGALGVLTASIGFNVAHDAAHEAFSEKKFWNMLLGYAFNLLGVLVFLWKKKHNKTHHTYTNVYGEDDDLEAGALLRLHKDAKWFPIHRFQHFYAPLAYSLLYFWWVLVGDLRKMVAGKIANHKIQISRKEWFIFVVTKVLYVAIWVVAPIMIIGVSAWAIVFFTMHAVCGVYMSFVFQLAHIVEDVEQPTPIGDPETIQNEAMTHQMETTADFATDNRVLFYLLGGLNFQREHHAFPNISHVHYPVVHRITRDTCREFGIKVVEYLTVRSALAAHFGLLKKLSKKPA